MLLLSILHPCPKEVSNTFALNCNHVDDRNIYHVLYHFLANFIGFSKIPKLLYCCYWLWRGKESKEVR